MIHDLQSYSVMWYIANRRDGISTPNLFYRKISTKTYHRITDILRLR